MRREEYLPLSSNSYCLRFVAVGGNQRRVPDSTVDYNERVTHLLVTLCKRSEVDVNRSSRYVRNSEFLVFYRRPPPYTLAYAIYSKRAHPHSHSQYFMSYVRVCKFLFSCQRSCDRQIKTKI